MNFLAQLIPPTLSQSQEVNVLLGGCRTEMSDEQHLQCFTDILLGVDNEDIYEVLRNNLPFKWFDGERYDTINTFGDNRQIQYQALWTFDIERNLLIHVNRYGRRKLPLSLLLEGTVLYKEMQFIWPPFPQVPQPIVMSERHCWEPKIQIDERVRVISHRLLRDFNHQWRHILRNEYNLKTLRILATAAIRLSTLEFDIHEESGERHHNPTGTQDYVRITDLPSWEPFPFATDIIPIGNIYVIVCTSLAEGLSKSREHKACQRPIDHTYPPECFQLSYMILSVKYIMLCRITKDGTFDYTKPELLLNGSSEEEHLSERALDYLIWSVNPGVKAVQTPLQLLPTEVQDMILSYVSNGAIAAKKIGCDLGIGSPFSWKCGSQVIKLQEVWKHRHVDSPVESRLQFNDRLVGLVYQAKRDN